jgi:hypothetical protein
LFVLYKVKAFSNAVDTLTYFWKDQNLIFLKVGGRVHLPVRLPENTNKPSGCPNFKESQLFIFPEMGGGGAPSWVLISGLPYPKKVLFSPVL